jgi:hypothetical protein
MIPALILFSLVWLVSAISLGIVIRSGAAVKQRLFLALAAFAAVVYSSYRIGEFDGRGRYYNDLRAELSPFLRKISLAPDEKKKEAIKDFFLGADEIKTDPSEYLASLKYAHELLKKEPNQTVEPTPPSRGGSP